VKEAFIKGVYIASVKLSQDVIEEYKSFTQGKQPSR
jgi:hypothetical protein